MRELHASETQYVGGGYRAFISVGLGFMGNYLYDAVGGMEGVNSFLSSANNYMTDVAYKRGDVMLSNPWSHGYID